MSDCIHCGSFKRPCGCDYNTEMTELKEQLAGLTIDYEDCRAVLARVTDERKKYLMGCIDLVMQYSLMKEKNGHLQSELDQLKTNVTEHHKRLSEEQKDPCPLCRSQVPHQQCVEDR